MPLHVDAQERQLTALGHEPGVRLSLPASFGRCHVDFCQLEAGLSLVRSCYAPRDDLVEEVVREDGEASLVLTLAMAGHSDYVGRHGANLHFRQGRATLATFSRSRGERRFPGGAQTRQLRLVFSADALQRYMGSSGCEKWFGDDVRLLQERPIPTWCQAMLGLLQAPASPARPLARHIAAFTLATEFLSVLAPPPDESASTLSAADGGKLELAYEHMRRHLEQPLTIPYLSAIAGMNTQKFKEGFRRHFGTTPHQALLGLRMERARLLLAAGLQVAQVAWQVGYAHPANFSAAFSRHFGQSPKRFKP